MKKSIKSLLLATLTAAALAGCSGNQAAETTAAPAETAAPQPSQSQVVGPGAASQPSENSSGGPGAAPAPAAEGPGEQ